MALSLLPHWWGRSVFDIDPAALARRGITLLLADLDNTLGKYGQLTPEQSLLDWKRQLDQAGVTLFILSNSRKPGRVEEFARKLGVPYLGHVGKPAVRGFQAAMEKMGRRPDQTAMVGDQIFTDILGAKRAGVLALMVQPVELAGNPGRYLRYAAEEPFRALGRLRTPKREE